VKEKTERKISRHFVCSEEESRAIEERAKAEKMTVSAYLRDAALHRNEPKLPGEAMELLREIAQNELRIGTNINQIARLANTEGRAGKEEYRNIAEQLERIHQDRYKILTLLVNLADGGDGDHEAAPA